MSEGAGGARRLVILSRDDYNRALLSAPGTLTDPTTRVVAVPLRPPDSEDRALLAIGDELLPNSLLLGSPSGGRYVEATAAYEVLSARRFTAFARICQRLGASLLEVKELREVSSEGNVRGAAVYGDGSAVKISGELNAESSRKLVQSIDARWVWRTGEAATCDPRGALQIAVEQGLVDDPVVMGLIDQFEAPGSRLVRHELSLKIGSEARRAIQAALEVETVLRQLGPKFNGTIDSLRKQDHEVVLSVVVDFNPDATRTALQPGDSS